MEDDDIILNETLQTLTVDQAVMRMLGYDGEFILTNVDDENDTLEFGISDYILAELDYAEAELGNAKLALHELKQSDSATEPELTAAKKVVAEKEASFAKARELTTLRDYYRNLINIEVHKAKHGKNTSLRIDEAKLIEERKIRIYRDSFKKWFEGLELSNTPTEFPVPGSMEVGPHEMPLSPTKAKNLHITFGLLLELFAESDAKTLKRAGKPNVKRIAERIAIYAKERKTRPILENQSDEAIKSRIEVAKYALDSES